MLRTLIIILSTFTSLLSISQARENSNVSSILKKTIISKAEHDSLTISIVWNDKNFPTDYGIKPIAAYHQTFIVASTVKKLQLLLTDNKLLFADVYIFPKEELTTGILDLAVNKANTAHHHFTLINGDSITISVKENKLDTTDIDFINRYRYTTPTSTLVTAHASVMATTIGGGGNSSPAAVGVAYAATITSANFASLLPEPDALYAAQKITVQNHSYGTLVQSFYGAEAAAYDQSAVANPNLVHIFSSGNAGNTSATSGAYSGITGFANLTGNFKLSKNSIVVGATDSFYTVSPLSSKGPAHDGRIKPELVAFGEDGSSGAAAMTSGAAALVQQAYRKAKGRVPSSALTKALLLNNADDLGTEGPDFTSGFGSLNVYNTLKATVEERYIEDAIGNGQVKTYPINVPANASRLKLTIVWTDPPVPVNSAKALVNDLDMVVKRMATGEQWQPWVLNTKPHRDSLTLPATRGRDTLNNVEQLTIANPAGGAYILEIRGASIATSSQSFAVAFTIDTAEYFEWTFPTGSDPLQAGVQNILRWQTNRTGNGTIEWSANGTIWTTIQNGVGISNQYYKWAAPDSITKVIFRWRLPNASYTSDTTVLSKAVELSTGYNCTDSFMFYWNRLPVPSYRLYELRGNYLRPFRELADTFIVLSKRDYPSPYYAAAPLISGKPGLRGSTLNYAAQGVECYLKSFFLQVQNGNTAGFTATLGTIYGVKAVSFQKLQEDQFITLQNISNPSAADFIFNDNNLSRGVNRFRIQVMLANGQVIYSDLIDVYYFPDAAVIIYPNPAKQNTPINIITSKGGQISIEVYNTTGSLVKNIKLTDQYQQVPSFSLAAGVYMMRIMDRDGNVETQRLIVY